MTSPIAGSVLPIKRAEELILTLPGVISARIIAGDSGAIDQIHVLTTSELTPKQMVRNIESALIAHLAMRIDHRKISVATTSETKPKLLDHESKQQPQATVPPPAASAAESHVSAGSCRAREHLRGGYISRMWKFVVRVEDVVSCEGAQG